MLNFGPVQPTRLETREKATFAITVDFVRGDGDPSRPFRTMVGLLDSIRRLDRDLARSVDVELEPVLVLEDVEAGSIKSWVATILRSADDDALKSGDWKKVLGKYLVDAKYIILGKIDDEPSITRPQLLEEIQAELANEAPNRHLGLFPSYTPLTRTQIAAHIADITESLKPLGNRDSASFEGIEGAPVRFNPGLRVNEEELNDLLAVRTISNKSQLILKVKKPDFLGSSMWEFHFAGHTINASVVDEPWLARFRKDGLGVRPGAALKALVDIEISYNENHEDLPPKYTVLEVYEVIPPISFGTQMALSDGAEIASDGEKKPLLLSAPPPDEI